MNHFAFGGIMAAMLYACGIFFMVSACQQCTPPPDPEAPTREHQCDEACARWRLGNCKNAEDVCIAFDAEGECETLIDCVRACVEEPERYDVAAECE